MDKDAEHVASVGKSKQVKDVRTNEVRDDAITLLPRAELSLAKLALPERAAPSLSTPTLVDNLSLATRMLAAPDTRVTAAGVLLTQVACYNIRGDDIKGEGDVTKGEGEIIKGPADVIRGNCMVTERDCIQVCNGLIRAMMAVGSIPFARKRALLVLHLLLKSCLGLRERFETLRQLVKSWRGHPMLVCDQVIDFLVGANSV